MTNPKDVNLDMLPADATAGNIFLLTIQGKLKPKTVEEARSIHNATAGHPQGVATCRSLGDLSHNVYISATEPKSGAFLILDRWTSPEGLQAFFSDKQVQEGGAQIFAERDPVLWAPTPNIVSFHLPTAMNRTDLFVGLLRGTVRSRDRAEAKWNEVLSKNINRGRLYGQISHSVYFRLTPPGQPASSEVLGLTTWFDLEGMNAFYRDDRFMSAFADMFSQPPATSVWTPPPGDWIEW